MFDYMRSNEEEGGYAPAFAFSREKLKSIPLSNIIRCSSCSYNHDKGLLYFDSFGQTFDFAYPDGSVYFSGTPYYKPKIGWRLLLLNYLSSAKDLPISGKWVSYRELPDGNVFFLNVLDKVLRPLSKLYDSCDKAVLKEALLQTGFSIIESKADLAAQAWFAPKIPVLIKFWDGDEEIPASCQILFDGITGEHMHIEDSSGLCYLVEQIITDHYNYLIKLQWK